MTVQTPREAAEALRNDLRNTLGHLDPMQQWATEHWEEIIESAFAARDRALLVEDEAALEAMARAITIPGVTLYEEARWRYARDALAALRKLRTGE